MNEHEYLQDALSSQKYICANYNGYASQCVLKNLKDTMLNILQDEHDIQLQLFNELSAKGWYDPQMVTQSQIDLLKSQLKR